MLSGLFRLQNLNFRFRRRRKNRRAAPLGRILNPFPKNILKKDEQTINLSKKAPINRIRDVGYTLNREKGPFTGRNQKTEVDFP